MFMFLPGEMEVGSLVMSISPRLKSDLKLADFAAMDRPDLPRDKDDNGAQRWPLNIDTIRKTAVHTINYLT
jgi:hypothetical protein